MAVRISISIAVFRSKEIVACRSSGI